MFFLKLICLKITSVDRYALKSEILYKRLRFFLIFLICFLQFNSISKANNIKVSNATLTEQNPSEGITQVTFNLNWENSWRLDASSGIRNWDAAWIFVKYRLPVLLGGDGVWKHAKLSDNGHKPSEGMQADAGLLNPRTPFNSSTNPAVGVFVYRSEPGYGTLNLTDVELRWSYTSNGVEDTELVEIEVYAIEMVFVPQGSFFVGSGGTETASFTDGSWNGGASIPLKITSENSLNIANSPESLWSVSPITGGELPDASPKGYDAFYMMKYNITQEQYVEFLNSLTLNQAIARRQLGQNSNRHSLFEDEGIYRTEDPFVAKNYMSWADGAAYLDWTGLRPMTELEYEKASRGSAEPVANAFSWGNTTISAATGIINQGAANEATTPIRANAVFGNQGNIQGPVRVGIFATELSNKESAGASFWGVMELSGSLWERAVSVGNETGRAYTGQHGDGLLNDQGNADVLLWPGTTGEEVTIASGSIIRGGSWISPSTSLHTSDRIAATQIENSGRLNNYGFRGVRTSPAFSDTDIELTDGDIESAPFKGGDGDGSDANRTGIKNLQGVDLKIWTGGTVGNTRSWFENNNWIEKLVPGPDDPILIPRTDFQPIISGVSPANDIPKTGKFALKDGTSLTLEPGPVLTLSLQTDFITEGSARIILLPHSNYLNLSRSNPSLEVLQTIDGGKGWRMLGPPVKATIYRQFLNGLVMQGINGSAYSALQPNVLWFDETDGGTTLQGWRRSSNVNDPVRLGRGHYVYVFNGANLPGRSETYDDQLPITLNVTGKEHNFITDSAFRFSVTYTPAPSSGFQQPNVDLPDYIEVATLSRGFNLISNPTASVLDFFREGAWTKKNLDKTIYIWDPEYSDGGSSRKGGWRVYNGTTGNMPNEGRIAPYQAFWIRTNDRLPELLCNSNLAKSASPSTYLSRLIIPENDEMSNQPLILRLSVKGEGMKAESWISFEPNGIPGPDPSDSYQLESLNDDWLLLYSYGSQRHQIPLQINNLDPLGEEEKSIPLMLAASLSGKGFTGNYQLEWHLPEQWPEDFDIVLMDHINEKAIDMRETNVYDFRLKAPEKPGARESFNNQLVKFPGPVIFNSPYATGDPTLRQTTGSLSSRPFTVRIGRKLADGSLSYRSDHPHLLPPAPNPFQSNVRINFYIPYRMNAQVVVSDLNGRQVKVFPMREYESGSHQIVWNAESGLITRGIYLVQLVTENTVVTQKLLKN